MRSSPVDLGSFHHSATDFTAVAFANNASVGSCRAFVASSRGDVFEIDCANRTLESVFHLHDGFVVLYLLKHSKNEISKLDCHSFRPIHAIAICPDFCAVATDNPPALAFWPLSFESALDRVC